MAKYDVNAVPPIIHERLMRTNPQYRDRYLADQKARKAGKTRSRQERR